MGSLAASAIVLIGWLVLRKLVLGSFIGGYGTEIHCGFHRVSIIKSIGRALIRIFLPPLPGYVSEMITGPVLTTVALFPLAYAIAGAMDSVRRNTAGFWLLVWAVLGIPISLVPCMTMAIPITHTSSERFLYLPGAFAAIAFAAAVGNWTSRKGAVAVLAVVCSLLWCTAKLDLRWVRATELAGAIAQELGRYGGDDEVVILNTADNFQGAYVLRNGTHEAATFFQGRKGARTYRVLCSHDVLSLEDRFDWRVENGMFVLDLPEGRQAVPPSSGDSVRYQPPSRVIVDPRAFRKTGRERFVYLARAGSPPCLAETRGDSFSQ